jgi:hypothetical protein
VTTKVGSTGDGEDRDVDNAKSRQLLGLEYLDSKTLIIDMLQTMINSGVIQKPQ